MGSIFSQIKLNRKQIAFFLLFMLLASVSMMLLPTMLANMIDNGVAGSDFSMILSIAVIMAVVALFGCVTNIAATTLSVRITTKFAADIRRTLFEKVQSFSSAEMEHFGTASLVTRSTSDVTNVQMFLTVLLRLGIMAPLMAVAGLVFSSLMGGGVSFILLIAIPALLLGVGVIIIFVSRYSAALREKIDLINRLFLETLEGVRVIRAFNRQRYEADRFEKANQEYADLTVISGRISGLLVPLVQVAFGVTTAAVMAVGSGYVSSGRMDVGTLVANSQYISMILAAVMLLSLVVMMFPMSYACAKRIGEVLKTVPSITDGTCEASERSLRSTVVFDHVTFTYPGAEEPVLKDISFESRSGEITAIIGRTGCGKSSVLKLIPRLYDTLSGNIYVDGIDIKKYKRSELRGLVGYIPICTNFTKNTEVAV